MSNNSNGVKALGRIIWWNSPGVRPRRGSWDAALKTEGLSEFPDSSPEAIAGRTIRRAGPIFREHACVQKDLNNPQGGALRAYAILSAPEIGQGQVDPEHVLTAEFFATTMTVTRVSQTYPTSEADAIERGLEAIYQDEVGFTSTEEISKYVVNWIRHSGGIPLSDGGKPYFIPLDDVGSMDKALQAIGWRLGQNRTLGNDVGSKATVVEGATEEFLGQVKDIEGKLDAAMDEMAQEHGPNRRRAIASLADQAQDLHKLADHYNTILNDAITTVAEQTRRLAMKAALNKLAAASARE